MKAAIHHYHVRMHRVLDYIDRHLDDDQDLATLSDVAAFKPVNDARRKIRQITYANDDVAIRTVASTRVAMFEHHGNPATINDTGQRFFLGDPQQGTAPFTIISKAIVTWEWGGRAAFKQRPLPP